MCLGTFFQKIQKGFFAVKHRLSALIFVCLFLFCSCTAQSTKTPPTAETPSTPSTEQIIEPEVFYADVILSVQTSTFDALTDQLISVSVDKNEYDQKALLIAQESFVGEEDGYRLTFEHDENGNRTKATAEKSPETSRIVYQGPIAWEYDEENRVTRLETRIGEVLAYTYDSEGRVLSRSEGGVGTDGYAWREEYIYSSDGSYLKNTYFALNADEMGLGTVCEYNSRGRILKEKHLSYFESGEVNQEYFYEYEEEATGKLTRRLKFDLLKKNQLVEVVECSYDTAGRLIKVVNSSVDDVGSYVVDLVDEVSYDENGRVEVYSCESAGRRREMRYEYGKIEVEKTASGKDLTKYDINDEIFYLGI